MYVVVKHTSVHFIHVAEDKTWWHVGVVTHNAQSGGGEKKTITLTVYISVCVQKN